MENDMETLGPLKRVYSRVILDFRLLLSLGFRV